MKNYYVAYDKNGYVIGCSEDKEWLKNVLGKEIFKIVNDKDYANCIG